MARMPPDAALEARAHARAQAARTRRPATSARCAWRVPDGRERWLMLRVHIVWAGERAVRLRGACIDITERRAVDDLLGRTQAELGQQVADLHRLHELTQPAARHPHAHRAVADDPGGAGRFPRRAARPADAVRHRLGHAGHRHQRRLHARRRRAPDADQRHRRRLRDLLRAARAHRDRGHRRRRRRPRPARAGERGGLPRGARDAADRPGRRR